MKFALVGQPNCGKSTLFNQVAGYKAETGNFSGTTITFTESRVRVLGEVVDLIDLPGTYTLAGTNPAECEVFRYLTENPVDVIINLVDASHLSQGLNLTVELLELGRPMVVALNMMDEVARMGMEIDGPQLQELLKVDVLPLIASKGRGVRKVFTTAFEVAQNQTIPQRQPYSLDLETAIAQLIPSLDAKGSTLQNEALAIKLMEDNTGLLNYPEWDTLMVKNAVKAAKQIITERRGQPAIWAFNAERHGLASRISRQVVQQSERRFTRRDYLDNFLLHPFWGYVALVVILWLFFQIIYSIGSSLEEPLLAIFDQFVVLVVEITGPDTFLSEVLVGVIQGISGGVAIVIPYLIPFLLGLSIMEDIGYLPRLAFLMDALMHRLGLHGKAIVPFILGYGCNVPAVMSTRMLEARRDRFMAATLATLVPCAARMAVVFGLVAFYLGPGLALAIYIFNLIVIAVTGRILTIMIPEVTPGLILEIPVYRFPTVNSVIKKTWYRAREFIVEAWPLLIIGSVVLSILDRLNFSQWFNALTRPITWLLGLPTAVGVPLIFGILRKELSLIMLRQALGVTDFSQGLTNVQMVTFAVFVVFYIPCLATLAVLKRELNTRDMFLIAGLTVLIATLTALMARGFALVLL
jgi:ferrous iron transport protein B